VDLKLAVPAKEKTFKKKKDVSESLEPAKSSAPHLSKPIKINMFV